MGENLGAPAALGLAGYGVRRPFFCVFHGTYFDNRKFRLLAPLLRRMPNFHLLCLSEKVASRALGEFGFDAARCHVLGVATDTEFFRPHPLDASGVVASAGVVERDYATLFKAVEGLDLQVELATNSAWTTSFDLGKMAIPANVKAGPLPMFTGLRDLYARSRFVVLPLNPVGFACGFSVILEAMAMGKGVIASRNPGHSDLILPEVTGLYVECGDWIGLRAAIQRLSSNPDEAERMGQAGRARIVELGSMSRYGELVAQSMRNSLAVRTQVRPSVRYAKDRSL
jgi:glycosyltransferase involved in cell wall biosynthesis